MQLEVLSNISITFGMDKNIPITKTLTIFKSCTLNLKKLLV